MSSSMDKMRSFDAERVESLVTRVSLIAGASSPRLAYTDIGTSLIQRRQNEGISPKFDV